MAKKKTAGTRAGRSRRGKGESNTEASAAQIEVRTGSLIPAVDLSDKDINHHFNSIKRATETKDSAVSALRTAMKKADETHPGLGAEIKDQIQLERKNDVADLAAELTLKARVLKARGTTIQLSVFDTLAGDEMALIYKRFYQDGKAGKPLDNPYPAGSDLALQAARAWRHGTASNMGVSAEDADKALDDDELQKLAKLPAPPDMSSDASTVH